MFRSGGIGRLCTRTLGEVQVGRGGDGGGGADADCRADRLRLALHPKCETPN